jgi:hypothetical protein
MHGGDGVTPAEPCPEPAEAAARAAAAPEAAAVADDAAPPPAGQQVAEVVRLKRYRVKVKTACRTGIETSSTLSGSLHVGDEVVALQEVVNSAGVRRILTGNSQKVVGGWISNKPHIVEELEPLDLRSSRSLGGAAVWAAIAAKLRLTDDSYGENDEGDYDYYSCFHLRYADHIVWSAREHRGSNVSCAWGKQVGYFPVSTNAPCVCCLTTHAMLGGGPAVGGPQDNSSAGDQCQGVSGRRHCQYKRRGATAVCV